MTLAGFRKSLFQDKFTEFSFSFFLSYSDIFLFTRRRCRGLFLYLITLTDTHTHTIHKTSLDEGSACRRVLYLVTHNVHKKQKSMPPVGFEPAIPKSEWPQTLALDGAVTRIK